MKDFPTGHLAQGRCSGRSLENFGYGPRVHLMVRSSACKIGAGNAGAAPLLSIHSLP